MKIVMLLSLLVAGTCSCATTNTLPQPIERPEMVTGPEWGSTPKEFPETYKHKPRQILLHHAGEIWKPTDQPAAKIKGLQTWGQRDKNWMDVPYHFMIAPNGQIFEGRALEFKPDTNTNFDTSGYINVHLWGNFEEQRVTEDQLLATVKTCAWLVDKYDLDAGQIITHKDAAPGQTSCPGKDFYRYVEMKLFEQWVMQELAGAEPSIRLLEPLPSGPTEMIPIPELFTAETSY